jgi:hypothetical protein
MNNFDIFSLKGRGSSYVDAVKKRNFIHLAVMLLATTPAFAGGKGATVTEAVNQVDHGMTQSSDTQPAKIGTMLGDGEYLKTGVKSRAELELANQSITRLGANTIFNYSAADNQIDLQAGTVLFSKPKDGQQMNIKTAAVTAAIVGTTGFMQRHGKSVLFGLIEGKGVLTIGDTTYVVHGGEILKFAPGQPPQIFAFNVPLFMSTSPLITRFHHHLPNQRFIDEEIADYNDLVERGFIQPPKDPFYLVDFEGTVPTIPIPGTDSAGNALNLLNQPQQTQVQDDCRPRCCPPCGPTNNGPTDSFVRVHPPKNG